MDNQLNNFGKRKNISDFMTGFFGSIAIILFIIWLPKIDFSNTVNAAIFIVGLLFSILYGIFVYKNTYTDKWWHIHLHPKNTYFSKGLMVLSATIMVFVLLFVLYCFVVPAPEWLWNYK